MTIAPHLRFSNHEVWVDLLLFFCLLLFTWVRVTNPKKIPSLVSGFFQGGFTEEKTITPDSIALFFIFICSASLFIMQAFRVYTISTRFDGGEEFLLLCVVLLVYYFLKTIALFFCGVIFRVESNAGDYISEIYSSAHLAGVGLFPAIVVLTFVSNMNEALFEKGILAVLALLFIYRTIKMFILMMSKGLSVIYLFLYLCTLEIIPLVLLFEFGKSMNL